MTQTEKTQVSLQLPRQLVADFDRIAAALDRDRAWVFQTALAHYLAGEGAEILQDAEGIAEFDRGESVDLDEVIAKALRLVEEAEDRRRRRAG
ncbi:CopG family ribbon-helix-helix protein [Ciceribacter sp. RN22]|uniref:CopG family ribbon-helix-helix protein n=1 Tax=Ciceribacter sp. RN22 TaxID=2954932 RepID=UPI002093C6CE|nr:ribbon-helix-helix protein, CopG family [Ciceribacter sp. RN22]MCO6177504.1 ribbon-helix-helix protein, CopG family [Ciceribacter sp. RN22]